MILAFHGESSLKSSVMDRLREHLRLDTIVQGRYYEHGRGCHLGCLTHVDSDTHETAERLFGIERRVGYWLEAVFECLPPGECERWVIESTEAIPVGADLSLRHHHFGAWLLGESGLLTIVDCSREAIEQVRKLHVAAARGEYASDLQWSAARSAARSACSAYSAADSAYVAARSAACSAYSAADSAYVAARSAAYSACSAADSACSATRSARSAYSAAWTKIAAKSIEIFAQAPVVLRSTMEAEIERDLCCKNLWCRDGRLIDV